MAVKSLSNSSILQPFQTNSMLGDYESNYFHHLETVRLGGNAASITFSNLARYSDYQHLQIRMTGRVTETIGGSGTFYTRLNGDSGTNYARHILLGNGSSVSSNSLTGTSTPDVGYGPGAESGSGIFSAAVIDLLDPFEAKNKTIRTLSGFSAGYKAIALNSVLWLNTTPVTSWSINPYGSHSFIAGSRFSLYGIKARS